MVKKRTRKRPPDVAEHLAAMNAFNLFAENDEGAPRGWTPPPSRSKVDYTVAYEYTGPREGPKADIDDLWGAIERLADADPTPSPWRSKRA